jgi:hypothetical protein
MWAAYRNTPLLILLTAFDSAAPGSKQTSIETSYAFSKQIAEAATCTDQRLGYYGAYI